LIPNEHRIRSSLPERYPKRKSGMALLSDILDATHEHVRTLRRTQPALERAAAAAPPPRAWRSALEGDGVAIIAEVKRRSPSVGPIAPDLDPAGLAAAYAEGGAAALSVLTNEPFFGGSLADLDAARAVTTLPVLRKDFLVDPVQLYESRAAGASAVLLIVRALDGAQLHELSSLAAQLGLARLVEVHTMAELEAAAALAPEAIGVNSRDLDTFAVSLDAVEPLLAAVPDGTLAVAESGIARREDVERVARAGADAVLVGTAVARASNPAAAVATLAGVPRAPEAVRSRG